uniref:Mitogen-activated protein kinase n=1 Tax=Mycena chlorophos TaxID=658473 RepID=A0ABQ0LQX1_MYCCL|nr:mitogen-activated protein kinase [Mycena chlorophos]
MPEAAAASKAAPAPRKVRFNVGTQYQVLDVVGEGAYGIVCSAVYRPSGRKVAIKKIAPFEHSLFCLRTLRELKLLKFLSEAGVSENIISIIDIIKPSSLEQFKEVYLVQELMETDMHRVIRTQDLSDDHAQYFVYQTLRALKALHSADVIHRDLKPSNLLLNANCDLKVADFGLARSVKTAEPSGTETDEFYAISTRRSRDYIRALPFRKRRPFSQIIPKATPLAVDFLNKTLTFDPKKRITAEEALAHPYLEAYHDPDDEPVAPPLDPEFFEFDLHKDDISRDQLKELYQPMCHFWAYSYLLPLSPVPVYPAARSDFSRGHV